MAKTTSTCQALFTIWRNAARASWRVLAGPVPKSPTPRMAVARTVAEERATIEVGSVSELRTKHGVVLVKYPEHDRKLSAVPCGVYGYATPWSPPMGEITLGFCRGTAVLEIHKAKDGTRYLIGYAGELPGKEFTLSTKPWGACHRAVAVPLVRIISFEERSAKDMWFLDIKTDECEP